MQSVRQFTPPRKFSKDLLVIALCLVSVILSGWHQFRYVTGALDRKEWCERVNATHEGRRTIFFSTSGLRGDVLVVRVTEPTDREEIFGIMLDRRMSGWLMEEGFQSVEYQKERMAIQ
jgi:hypothetical protein